MSQMKAQVDKLLTDVSSAYFPKEYISEMILPTVMSAQYTGLLGKHGTNHLRIENTVTGGRGKFRRVETRSYSTQTYVIDDHGVEGFVSARDYANVEKPFDAERDETLGLATVLWLEKEKALADTLSDTAVLTQNVTLAGIQQYSDYDNSTPIEDFSTARAAIMASTGQVPNIAIMDWGVKNKLRYHPELLDNLGYKFNRAGGLTDDELARALDVESVLVGKARYESAVEGQTSALLPCWGKHIIFAVAPPKAEIMQTSLGYMIRLTGSSPRQIFKESNFNPPGSTKILCTDSYDMLISNALAGYLIKNAIA